MFTKPKLVILLIVIGISIGLVTSEALAGPPGLHSLNRHTMYASPHG